MKARGGAPRWWRSVGFGAALLAGCAPRATTEIVVVVTSDYEPLRELVSVRLEATREGQPRPFAEAEFSLAARNLRTPGEVVLAPRDPADARRVLVRVEARLATGETIRQEALAQFRAEHRLYLQMSIARACLIEEPRCRAMGQTCRVGRCTALSEATVATQPPTPEVTFRDGGSDAGLDAAEVAADVGDDAGDGGSDLGDGAVVAADQGDGAMDAADPGMDAPAMDTPVMDAPMMDAPAMDTPAMDSAEAPPETGPDSTDAAGSGMEAGSDIADGALRDTGDAAAPLDAPDLGPPDTAPTTEVADAPPRDLSVPESCPGGTTPCPGGCFDTTSSLAHCGGCGRACGLAGARSECAVGTCVFLACEAGFGNCNGMAADGCEVDTRTSVAHCGACGTVCPFVLHGAAACEAGRCGATCERGFVARDGACAYDTPRPVTPNSVAWVGSHQPTLRWIALDGADATLVRICSARSCDTGTIEDTQVVSGTGTSTRPMAPLSLGWHWWQVFGRRGGSYGPPSPTWQFFVGAAGPRDLTLGPMPDFNGDGFGDVAVVASTGILVYRGSASGLPAEPSQRLMAASSCVVRHFGDVDGDGFSDLGVGCVDRYTIYAGGASGLTEHGSFEARRDFQYAAAGDVDGDGFGDILLYGNTVPYVIFGALRPFVSSVRVDYPTPVSPIPYYNGAAVGADINHDGLSDLVYGDASWRSTASTGAPVGRAFVYLAPAGGRATLSLSVTLSPPGPPANPSHFGRALAWFDGNRDGFPDLAVGERFTETASFQGRLSFYHGEAAGIPAAPSLTLAGTMTSQDLGSAIAGIGDFDSDGAADLAIGSGFSSAAHVRFTPGGALTTFVEWRVGSGEFPQISTMNNVDGDQFTDVVLAGINDPAPGRLLVFGGARTISAAPRQIILPPSGSYFVSVMR
ncbi:MAG: VCBS repeat-containing protein [Deltaproteobacteria bacterium]|nr:VCBS repeat-containing protein [Deltaproteobacteria bacterium]